jgi:hypothetical protein
MNASKARDFFSAYYEGELTHGLAESFERALVNDAALKFEYEEFCSTMKMLEEPDVEIEVPFDLHDKIMARLDHQAWEAKQTQKAGLFGRWRLAMVGGLAAVAILAGVSSLNKPNNGSMSTSNFVPVNGTANQVTEEVKATFVDGALSIQIKAKSGSKYSIRKISDDTVLADLVVRDKMLSQVIINDNAQGQAFTVLNSKGEEKMLIVLPGTTQGTMLKGEGSVMDLSVAMADAFRTPMIVRAQDREKSVTWDFKADSDMSERSTMLKDQGLNLSLMEGRISLLSSF